MTYPAVDLADWDDDMGDAGAPGGGVTSGQLASAIADRAPANASFVTLKAEAGLSAESNLGALADGILYNDVTAGVASLRPAVGTDLPAHTHTGVPVALSIPLDGGGSAIAAGIKTLDIYVPFAATITGWEIGASASSTLQCTVLRAPAASPTTYVAISGTEKPVLSSQQTNSDLTLTTWTVSLAAGDRLRVDVDASPTPTAVLATLNLLMTRSI